MQHRAEPLPEPVNRHPYRRLGQTELARGRLVAPRARVIADEKRLQPLEAILCSRRGLLITQHVQAPGEDGRYPLPIEDSSYCGLSNIGGADRAG